MTQFAAATTFRVDPLAGVRTRRILALAIDLVLVSILAFVIWFALLILTLGLSLILLPPLFPLVAFFYNGFTVSGRKMSTPGMRAMDSKSGCMRTAPAFLSSTRRPTLCSSI